MYVKKRGRNWNRKLDGIGIGKIRRFPSSSDSASVSVAYFPLTSFSFPLNRKVLAIPIPLPIPLTSLTSLVGNKIKCSTGYKFHLKFSFCPHFRLLLCRLPRFQIPWQRYCLSAQTALWTYYFDRGMAQDRGLGK